MGEVLKEGCKAAQVSLKGSDTLRSSLDTAAHLLGEIMESLGGAQASPSPSSARLGVVRRSPQYAHRPTPDPP